MPKRDIEAELLQLNALRQSPKEACAPVLKKAMCDRVNMVVARAALLAAERNCTDLVPDLLAAYDRLFRDPAKSDGQCWGKNAIAKALKDLGHAESAPFLRGVGHVQMEPVWAGQSDTAGTLRATCALALVECRDLPREEIIRYLVDAVTDKAVPVRTDALRALLQMGGHEAALLLRLKARLGDEDPQVTGQALESVLSLEGERAIPWVARFLDATEEISDEAALVLGASRLPAAVEILMERWTKSRAPSAVLLRALGLSRTEAATHFLMDVAENGRPRDAQAAREILQSRLLG